MIIELGIGNENSFNYLNAEEAQRAQKILEKDSLRVMDWFCGIRYYKNDKTKSQLKFDYYMMRIAFGEKDSVDFLIFHERGPRYISPKELAEFTIHKINGTAKKQILCRT